MGKWLSKFSADIQGSLPDIPDTMTSVSGLSGPDMEVSAKNTPAYPQAETFTAAATPPLQPGWLVSYYQHDRLRGGCDGRDAGTVQACQWDGRSWLVILTNGASLSISRIVSVGQTDARGQVISAWRVRDHGVTGGGRT